VKPSAWTVASDVNITNMLPVEETTGEPARLVPVKLRRSALDVVRPS
jgi:hypothetical protein